MSKEELDHIANGGKMIEQPAQQKPVAWPCVIAEADFEQNTITLEMQCSDYKVGTGQHWLTTSPPAQRTWVNATTWRGLTDEEIEAEFGFIDELLRDCCYRTEAKLKEKNT